MAETRVYVQAELSEGLVLELSDEVFRHLVQVLRMKSGQRFIAFDGRGGEFDARLDHVEKRRASAKIGARSEISRESPVDIVLAQSVGKGERMDWAVQKAVEAGASRLVPVLSERCNVSIDPQRQARRLQHWQGVIVSACEQSGRTRIPELSEFTTFSTWVSRDEAPLKLVLDGSGVSLHEAVPSRPEALSVCVGPEGGFSEAELAHAMANGYNVVRLGPRVLRTETAGVAAIAALQALHGDWR